MKVMSTKRIYGKLEPTELAKVLDNLHRDYRTELAELNSKKKLIEDVSAIYVQKVRGK